MKLLLQQLIHKERLRQNRKEKKKRQLPGLKNIYKQLLKQLQVVEVPQAGDNAIELRCDLVLWLGDPTPAAGQ